MDLKMQIQAKIAEQVGPGCTMCPSTMDFVGMYVPHNPQSFGAPPGKTRAIFYSVCNRCASDPDLVDDYFETFVKYSVN